jgi:hypothetical protein
VHRSTSAFNKTESGDFIFGCIPKFCLGGLVGWDKKGRCCSSSEVLEKLNQHFTVLWFEKFFLFLSYFMVYLPSQFVRNRCFGL